MPEEQTSQTPQPTETGSPQTSVNGTDGQTAAAAAPATPPVQEIDYRQKFTASQAEAMRLYQENQRLNAILANTVQQQQAAAQPQTSADNYHADLADAVLDRNLSKIADWENRVVEKAKQSMNASQQEEGRRNLRIQASMAAIQPAFQDPAMGHEVMSRYQQMIYDPAYSFVQRDEIDVPTPNGAIKVNPHLMRLAVQETQVKFAGRLQGAAERARQESATFIEPSGGGTPARQNSGQFDASKHLSDTERGYCDRQHKPYDQYWKFMDPRLQQARLKAGRAVSREEAKI